MSLPTLYQDFIHKRTYARWKEEEQRRETWDETVDRYRDYFRKRVPEHLHEEWDETCEAIRNLEIMPSMRSLWTAGPALDVDNIAGYNCSYTPIDKYRRFSEILYILMNGTGVGFSVEERYISQLPVVPYEVRTKVPYINAAIVFEDSKLGWAEGYLDLLACLYDGFYPQLNYHKIRPEGERLKTFGGRASGPEPLIKLCEFTVDLFKKAQGRKLTSLECYDLVCLIANCVVVGGVRRSATINLSDLSDTDLRDAKVGAFWDENPQRMLSNNSAVYEEKPSREVFQAEWDALVKSGAGERGIVNRKAMQDKVQEYGREVVAFGTNPCGEIILRPQEFCNLSEVVVREDDTLADLVRKVRQATILGTVQSTLTDFQFLDDSWSNNTKEERLLGVSLTGVADKDWSEFSVFDVHGSVSGTGVLKALREYTHRTNERWSAAMGIEQSAAITCVKPSGTVSQLVDSASGLHDRHSPYYIRRVRVNATDPLAKYLIAQGMSWDPEVGQDRDTCNTVVFSFPMKAPESANYCDTAMQQLQRWKWLSDNWCDHNPSCTITVKEDEWEEVGNWVYENFDSVGGLSFLPKFDNVYQLAPYEAITEVQFNEMCGAQPSGLDFDAGLMEFEKKDETEGSREFACVGGVCEV